MASKTVVDDSTAAVTEKAAEIAADVEASQKGEQRRDAVTLSTGVILKLKPVPQLALREVISRFKRPEIPEVWNADKDRMEENPIHPDYLAALQRYNADMISAANDLYLMLGTEAEFVPDNIPDVDNEEWISIRDVLGLETTFKNRHHRYLCWLKMTLTKDADVSNLIRSVFALNGTVEIEVQEAAASFRDQQGR